MTTKQKYGVDGPAEAGQVVRGDGAGSGERVRVVELMAQKRDSHWGVPPVQMQPGSGFPLYSWLIPRCGAHLRSITRMTALLTIATLVATTAIAQSKVKWEQEAVKYQYADTSGGEIVIVKGIELGTQMQVQFGCCFSDSVNVLLNGKLLERAYFNTDPSTSLARSITVDLGEGHQVLRVELPEKRVCAEIVLDKSYRVLHVNRMVHWNKTWWVTFQNFHSVYE
ncbi:MAG: hypothetical protein KF905_14805 [Flavobacteriales bacterium]|nr:hypothetical protein [Flavobacteriales bacterium]